MRIPMIYDQFGHTYLQKVAGNKIHSGIDLNWGEKPNDDFGLEVNSMADGIVVFSENDRTAGWGNIIVIEHPQLGIWSRYAHLSQRLVNIDDNVQEGQLIGHCGNTGSSSAAHLHWDVIIKKLPTWKKYTTNYTIAQTKEYYADPIDCVNNNQTNIPREPSQPIPAPTRPNRPNRPSNPNNTPNHSNPMPDDQWKQIAQTWIIQNGVSNGERPNDPITRVELWETLRKYHQRAESIPRRIPR